MCRVHRRQCFERRSYGGVKPRSFKVPNCERQRQQLFLQNLSKVLLQNSVSNANRIKKRSVSEIQNVRTNSKRANVLLDLYRQCKETFRNCRRDRMNGVENMKQLKPSNIQNLGRTVNRLNLSHLNITVQDAMSKIAASGSNMGHVSLFELEDCSVSVFVLLPGACIPLHDHPGMCVLTKILHGSARIVAYDKVSTQEREQTSNVLGSMFEQRKSDSIELVVPITDKVVGTGTTRALFPNGGGNIHLVQADPISGCIMIDIQAPPYAEGDAACQYYNPLVTSVQLQGVEGNRAVLEKAPVRHALRVEQLKYKGPRYWD